MTAEEEAFLGMVIQKSPDQKLVEAAHYKFLMSNLRMAGWMAQRRKFEVAVTSFEDVMQAAMIGISRAVERFDPLYGFKFSTYAHNWMLQAIQSESARAAGVNIREFVRIPKTLWAIHHLRTQTGKMPTIPEIAVLTGHKMNEVQKTLDAYAGLRAGSLDDDKDGKARSGHDSVGVESDGIANAVFDDFFRRAKDFLDDGERDILENVILNEEMSISEFADSRGVKYGEVNKRRAAILAKLQHPYFGFGSMLAPRLFDWQQDAECFLGEDSRVLTQDGRTLTSEVHELCGGCEANTQCRTFAERQKPSSGIWAGQASSFYTDNPRSD